MELTFKISLCFFASFFFFTIVVYFVRGNTLFQYKKEQDASLEYDYLSFLHYMINAQSREIYGKKIIPRITRFFVSKEFFEEEDLTNKRLAFIKRVNICTIVGMCGVVLTFFTMVGILKFYSSNLNEENHTEQIKSYRLMDD